MPMEYKSRLVAGVGNANRFRNPKDYGNIPWIRYVSYLNWPVDMAVGFLLATRTERGTYISPLENIA
ncbi:MAG: hypothetical protein V1802_02970 [Candidatus Aenigmatarchaeota archaeon]